jgi:hypothetical protein
VKINRPPSCPPLCSHQVALLTLVHAHTGCGLNPRVLESDLSPPPRRGRAPRQGGLLHQACLGWNHEQNCHATRGGTDGCASSNARVKQGVPSPCYCLATGTKRAIPFTPYVCVGPGGVLKPSFATGSQPQTGLGPSIPVGPAGFCAGEPCF